MTLSPGWGHQMEEFLKHRPAFRASVQLRPGPSDHELTLVDATRIIPGGITVSKSIIPLFRHLNGQQTVASILSAAPGLTQEIFREILQRLDEANLSVFTRTSAVAIACLRASGSIRQRLTKSMLNSMPG
jgi:hypothetical protein